MVITNSLEEETEGLV